MRIIWRHVRRVHRMYGIAIGHWFVGVSRFHDPGVIYRWPA